MFVEEHDIDLITPEQLFKIADYISLHCPLTDETQGIINHRSIDLMKAGVSIINTARGGLVVESDLVAALESGKVANAGLDVFEQEPVDPENPLLSMDNVATTNHYASYSEIAWERAQTQLGEEATRIATGSLPMSFINKELISKIPKMKPAQLWEVYKENFK